jgi:hypothetical protein
MAKRKQPRRIWRRRVWPSRWVPTEPKGDLWIAPGPRKVRLLGPVMRRAFCFLGPKQLSCVCHDHHMS